MLTVLVLNLIAFLLFAHHSQIVISIGERFGREHNKKEKKEELSLSEHRLGLAAGQQMVLHVAGVVEAAAGAVHGHGGRWRQVGEEYGRGDAALDQYLLGVDVERTAAAAVAAGAANSARALLGRDGRRGGRLVSSPSHLLKLRSLQLQLGLLVHRGCGVCVCVCVFVVSTLDVSDDSNY